MRRGRGACPAAHAARTRAGAARPSVGRWGRLSFRARRAGMGGGRIPGGSPSLPLLGFAFVMIAAWPYSLRTCGCGPPRCRPSTAAGPRPSRLGAGVSEPRIRGPGPHGPVAGSRPRACWRHSALRAANPGPQIPVALSGPTQASQSGLQRAAVVRASGSEPGPASHYYIPRSIRFCEPRTASRIRVTLPLHQVGHYDSMALWANSEET